MRRAILVVSVVAASFFPSTLRAQTDASGGLWWALSVHAAGARLTCDVCARSRDLGGALEASAGAYASPQVRVGVELGGWTRKEDNVREDVFSAGLVAEIHPSADRGFHLVGGLGWAGYRAGDFTVDAPRVRLGAGWDFPVTGAWVVGNRVLLDAGSFATLNNDGDVVAESVGLSLVRFAVYVRHR